LKPKKEVFKIPKTTGECADLLYEVKAKRLAMQKQVEVLEENEKALKDHIIQTLPKSNASGVAGKVARVSVYSEDIPQVEDWDAFYAFVKKNDAFELLQRRVATMAVTERLEAKQKIPGVKIFQAKKVSLNKL
jgi:hypothetical protein